VGKIWFLGNKKKTKYKRKEDSSGTQEKDLIGKISKKNCSCENPQHTAIGVV